MKRLKLIYFIITVELIILGLLVFVEKNQFNAKDNFVIKNDIIQDKRNNIQFNEHENNDKFKKSKYNHDEVSKKIQNKILNRDEIKESIENNLSNYGENMSQEEIDIILKDEAISVFKVECSSIMGSLNFQDKKNILNVAMKVDKKMFNTIKELLHHDNQEYGVLKSILLLRDYLDEKDFEKVRETAGKYVDMNMIEEYYYLEKSGASYQ
ncbi:hypothetical protein [Oceanirhabdus sp. W0125-5]|uniref:hypothetical protein n=1 Tax=Oceanirhabdus sp. W0125-5 TaxID=2999116 RepID=UPI0022F2C9DE|nr:hypothetical protein [Oceanirhabdus sp. W0125-5]WBW98503.1 hypothetical protein OW730_06960 [Oceanirhabdus sp. W0125-5]